MFVGVKTLFRRVHASLLQVATHAVELRARLWVATIASSILEDFEAFFVSNPHSLEYSCTSVETESMHL